MVSDFTSTVPAYSYAVPAMEWLFSISAGKTHAEPAHVGVLPYPSFTLVGEAQYEGDRLVRALVRFRCFTCSAAMQFSQLGVTACVGCYRRYPTVTGRPGAVLVGRNLEVGAAQTHLESWLGHHMNVLEASLVAADLFTVPWAPPKTKLRPVGGMGLGDVLIDEYLGLP